jgi:hypothetical protein
MLAKEEQEGERLYRLLLAQIGYVITNKAEELERGQIGR